MNRSLKSKLTNAARRLVQKYPDDPDAQALARELVPAPPSPSMSRDELIAVTVMRFWPGQSDARASRLFRDALRNYSASAWLTDKWHEKPPEDERQAAFWLILSKNSNIPAERTVREKLADFRKVGGSGFKLPAA